jgi:Spy/CpxP family protein refolding chaperone
MKTIIAIVFTIILVGSNVSSSDQKEFEFQLLAQLEHDHMNNEQHGKRQEEMHKKFEQLKLIKMLELLDLDEEAEVQFISLYRQHNKGMKELMRDRKELHRGLRKLIGSKSEDQKLYDELFEKINNIDIKQIELTHSYLTKVKSVLTYEQVGKKFVNLDNNRNRAVAVRKGINLTMTKNNKEKGL